MFNRPVFFSKAIPRFPRRTWAAVVLLALVLCPRLPWPPLRAWVPSSQAVYDREGRLLRLALADDDKFRLWLPLSEMPPALAEATLLKEDRWFRFHAGVNPWSLGRAFWSTFVSREHRMGGSTLTMQLARLRWRLKTRTIGGKLVQIFRALQLELCHTKSEILEAYLNLAPYGGNVEGVAAASLIYFGKDVGRLVPPEIITLAVIPQDPGVVRRGTIAGARERLWTLWGNRHSESRERLEAFDTSLILKRSSDLPFSAPHFVQDVLKENPRAPRLRTTLDATFQALVNRQIRSYVEQNRESGIRNAAALMVDVRTMEVLAETGSADYFDSAIQGQVNGTRAFRSPGSTLKPFMYALAMDQGLIHPMTVLKDAPFGYGGFNPENFDGDFDGPITVRDALIRSRNVPAVQLSMELREPDFYDFLKSAGIDLPRDRDHYGMGIILGGLEVTMEDLVRLYALLANEGELRPLRRSLDSREEGGPRLLSRDACFMVLDILKDNPPPGVNYRRDWVKESLPVYWKTGTSFAFKDAWAVGLFGPYALAVWIGNFDGVGNPAFVGVKTAGPLFFRIIEAVKAHEPTLEPQGWIAALNVEREKVCAASGQIPNGHCPLETWTWFVPGKSPIKKCEVHRVVPIRIKTGLRACSDDGSEARAEVYEFWPSDLLKIFRMAGIPRRGPPPFEPGCSVDEMGAFGMPPRITSPQKGLIYHHRLNAGSQESISLSASTDADVREVSWFANKTFLGKIVGDRPFTWKPQPGQYVVRVVDDQGRSDSLDVAVRAVR